MIGIVQAEGQKLSGKRRRSEKTTVRSARIPRSSKHQEHNMDENHSTKPGKKHGGAGPIQETMNRGGASRLERFSRYSEVRSLRCFMVVMTSASQRSVDGTADGVGEQGLIPMLGLQGPSSQPVKNMAFSFRVAHGVVHRELTLVPEFVDWEERVREELLWRGWRPWSA